jgi:hypothetical protein
VKTGGDAEAKARARPKAYTLWRASLTCLSCGRSAGAVETPLVQRWPIVVHFRPTGSPTARPAAWQRIRCPECGGATLLEDVETVCRRVEHVDWTLDAPRRGRPSRKLVELRRQRDR